MLDGMLRSLRSARACRGLTALTAALVGASLVAGCGAGPDPIAFQNRTFYAYMFNGNIDASEFEKPWKPWDYAAQPGLPEYKGVAVLDAHVHVSRPVNWVIRDANDAPGSRYIEYVSPNEYVFALYELPYPSNDLWRDVMNRYEQDAKDAGATFVGSRVPMATYNAQGRGYIVKRGVAAAKAPFVSMSREYILRGEKRLILVQVVHQGETLKPISDELYRVITSIEVL
ncbi:MAG: hypothetical protein NVS3B10_18190 [Polyangiales bacterium]